MIESIDAISKNKICNMIGIYGKRKRDASKARQRGCSRSGSSTPAGASSTCRERALFVVVQERTPARRRARTPRRMLTADGQSYHTAPCVRSAPTNTDSTVEGERCHSANSRRGSSRSFPKPSSIRGLSRDEAAGASGRRWREHIGAASYQSVDQGYLGGQTKKTFSRAVPRLNICITTSSSIRLSVHPWRPHPHSWTQSAD
jgi:hypothetical protein